MGRIDVGGPAGAQGSQGAGGAAGAQGSQGAGGAAGAQGSQGAGGAAGAQGSQGTQGDRGLVVLAKVKVAVAISATTMAGSATLDIAGLVLPAFTYAGNPIKVIMRLPAIKFSVANAPVNFSVFDATNNKEVVRENYWAPPTANGLFTGQAETEPITAFPDGTAFVNGTSYVWKGQIRTSTSGGDFSTSWAANSVFYGHLEVIEA